MKYFKTKALYGTFYEGQTCIHFLPDSNGQNRTLSGCNVDLNQFKKLDIFNIENVPFKYSLKFVNECFNVCAPFDSIPYNEYKTLLLSNGAFLIK